MNDSAAKPRIGVVGTGYWAEVVHAAGAAAHPGVDLVGVWGRDPGKAAALAQRHQVQAYDDFDALLDAVDVLTFAVPPDVQSELALRAARAGKHLLLEKPITLDLDAADRLVAAVEESAVSTVVFFTYRFVPFSGSGWTTSGAMTCAAAPPGGTSATPPEAAPSPPHPGAGPKVRCGTSGRTPCPSSCRPWARSRGSPVLVVRETSCTWCSRTTAARPV